MKRTKVPDFDEFFSAASDPLTQVVDTNNDLDDKIKELRSIGQEIKKTSTKDAPPVLGSLNVTVKDGVVAIALEKDGSPLPAKSLDKNAKTLFGNVETKAGLLNKRLKDVRKLKGLENATFKNKAKSPHQLELIGDKEALKANESEDAMDDMNRSLSKFNDRSDILVIYLNGPVTLGEAVSAIINAIKEHLLEMKKEFKISIKDGKPKLEGIPDSVEDFFPELLTRAWELLKATMEFLAGLKDALPELQDKLQKLADEAKELPGKLRDAATSANLSASELLKAGRATAANGKLLAAAPKMVTQLMNTMQETAVQLTGGITGRMEAAKNDGAAAPTAAGESSGEGE
jgi:cell division septum initiation protein DivIVA